MAYGELYYAEWTDRNTITHRISLQKDGYAGGASAIQIEEFTHSHGKQGQPLIEIFLASELSFLWLIETSTQESTVDDIAAQAEGFYRIVYKQGGVTKWIGDVLNDIGEFESGEYPFPVEIVATWGINRLRDQDYDTPFTTGERQTLQTILEEQLNAVGYGLGIQYGTTWQFSGYTNPIREAYIDNRQLVEFTDVTQADRKLTRYNVLRILCERFHLRLMQWNGNWHLLQPDSYIHPNALFQDESNPSIADPYSGTDLDTNSTWLEKTPGKRYAEAIKRTVMRYNHMTRQVGLYIDPFDHTESPQSDSLTDVSAIGTELINMQGRGYFTASGTIKYEVKINEASFTVNIVGVDQGNKIFTVDTDVGPRMSIGEIITVSGSTGNDGDYHVTNISGNGLDITVQESIPSGVADGTISWETLVYWDHANSEWTESQTTKDFAFSGLQVCTMKTGTFPTSDAATITVTISLVPDSGNGYIEQIDILLEDTTVPNSLVVIQKAVQNITASVEKDLGEFPVGTGPADFSRANIRNPEGVVIHSWTRTGQGDSLDLHRLHAQQVLREAGTQRHILQAQVDGFVNPTDSVLYKSRHRIPIYWRYDETGYTTGAWHEIAYTANAVTYDEYTEGTESNTSGGGAGSSGGGGEVGFDALEPLIINTGVNPDRLELQYNTANLKKNGANQLDTIQNIGSGASMTLADLSLTAPSNIYTLNHDSFTGFVANEHINHTGVSINAGTGLSGGGTIAATRTLSLSHLGLEALTDPNADRIVFWDDSAGASKWLGLGPSLTITTTTLDTIQDIRETAGPTFATAKLTNLTGGYLPYHVSDAAGLANSPIYTDGSNIGIGKNPNVPLSIYAADFPKLRNVDTILELDIQDDPGGILWESGTSGATFVRGNAGGYNIYTRNDINNITGGDLRLHVDSSGTLLYSGYIGTDNYVSETTGWRGTYAGEWDVRSLFADEIRTEAFIAETSLTLVGSEFIGRSRAKVAENFTLPANTGTVAVTFEDIEGHEGTQAFSAGDWLMIKVFQYNSIGLTVVEVWGTVTNYVDNANGSQTWTWTTQDDGGVSGEKIFRGNVAVDFGQSGDGYIKLDSLGTDTPVIDVTTWVTDPTVAGNHTVHTRLGKLSGIAGQVGFGLVARKDNNNYVSQWWNSDSDWGTRGVIGGNEYFRLGNTNQIAGWNFNEEAIYTTRSGTALSIGIAQAWTSGVFGLQIGTDTGNRIWIGEYSGGEYEFRVTVGGNHIVRLGSVENAIAGWNIDNSKLYKGTDIVLDAANKRISLANGAMLFGFGVGGTGKHGLQINANNYWYSDGLWKVYVDTANYIEKTASAVNIRGSLNADDITAGIITGRTLRTAASGQRFEVSAGDNKAYFYNSGGSVVLTIGQSGADWAGMNFTNGGSIHLNYGGNTRTQILEGIVDARRYANAVQAIKGKVVGNPTNQGWTQSTESGHAGVMGIASPPNVASSAGAFQNGVMGLSLLNVNAGTNDLAVGVFGRGEIPQSSPTGKAIGVYGRAWGLHGADTIGGYFTASSGGGADVFGIYATTTDAGGSGNRWAAYLDGDVRLIGDLHGPDVSGRIEMRRLNMNSGETDTLLSAGGDMNRGFAFIDSAGSNDNSEGIFACLGSFTNLLTASSSHKFSTSRGTTSKVNVYYYNGEFRIQNNSGSPLTVTIHLLKS